MVEQAEDIDLNHLSCEAEFEIGTRYYNCDRGIWIYVMITFGLDATYYRWLPWNSTANSQFGIHVNSGQRQG